MDIDCRAGWPGSVCVAGGSPLEDWDWVEAVSGYLKAAAGSGVEVVALGVDAAEALEELGLGRFGVHQEVGEVRDGEVPIVRRADGGLVAVGTGGLALDGGCVLRIRLDAPSIPRLPVIALFAYGNKLARESGPPEVDSELRLD